jgi:hypothetical protein
MDAFIFLFGVEMRKQKPLLCFCAVGLAMGV